MRNANEFDVQNDELRKAYRELGKQMEIMEEETGMSRQEVLYYFAVIQAEMGRHT